MTGPRATIASSAEGGQWQVFVYPDGASKIQSVEECNVTLFRGAATDVGNLATTDPFGPSVATLRFPAVTMFDRRGVGDLWWCVPDADVDICWVTEAGVVYRWEGYFSSFEYGEDGAGSQLTVNCIGAMRQMDNYLAKPEYLYAPLTFEMAILRQFSGRLDSRMGPARLRLPRWWDKYYTVNKEYRSQPWMIPTGVYTGSKWTGMVTRYTGRFEPVLTGYIQQLLSSMHTERGQFTLMLEEGRKPVLRHRDNLTSPVEDTMYVHLLWPGVKFNFTEDHSQKINAVYVTGRSLAGQTFTGMKVSSDGQQTTYVPFAYRNNVYPQRLGGRFDPTTMLREVQVPSADGMDAQDARLMAQAHLQKYMDPGITGSLSLSVDPLVDGVVFPRQAITAGMNIQLAGLFGEETGRMFHITEASCSGTGEVALTLDSKFRDQLTVQEVRLRGRDALAPTRMLTTGNWQPNIEDLLFPWSYSLGAGYIPFGSQALFRGLTSAENQTFPWTSITKFRPPKDPQWRDKYIRIGPRSASANNNWSNPPDGVFEWPILLSAAGTSKLIQIAAYDENGNVMPVAFHFSIWDSNSVSAASTPSLPPQYAASAGYAEAEYYPFWPGAWETVDADGVAQDPITPTAEATAGILIGWGNHYEQPGYWPGSKSDPKDKPTGLFQDETAFSWDLQTMEKAVNPQEPRSVNMAELDRAKLYCLIYCDQQLTQPVYFLGRIFRAEPGSA